ncbi:hypothetical protein LguiB_002990 [Lonicera macranthoides]
MRVYATCLSFQPQIIMIGLSSWMNITMRLLGLLLTSAPNIYAQDNVTFAGEKFIADTLISNESLSDGQTLVSPGQVFELGFFSSGMSKSRYLSICCWISAILYYMKQTLVIQKAMDGRVLIIQHTLLPGMKQGWDLKTGLNSWRSLDDPSPADYSYGVELNGLPQLVLRKGSTELYRSGLWYEDQFIGVPVLTPNSLFKPQFISNSEEVYYMFETTNPLLLSRLVMGQSALVQHLTWISHQHQWAVLFTIQKDRCDNCNLCGPFGVGNELWLGVVQ